MCGDRAPATGAGRLHTPTGPVGAGPRGAAAARAPPAAGYGDCRRQLAQDGCRRAGPIDDGPARAEARMTGVGGCIRSEHGRSRHAAAATTSARFESRAGWPLPPRGQPAGRHGQPPGPPPATYGPAPGRAGRARRPRSQPAPPWRPAALGGGPATLGWPPWPGWLSPFGGVAQPDFGPGQPRGQPVWRGGPARLGGWASPIWGGGWPGGRRASHPPDRAQTTTYGAPVPNEF